MPQQKILLLSLLPLVLAACWEDESKFEVGTPTPLYFVSGSVPAFEPCDWQDREALEREKRVPVLPTVECADGRCKITGRGYRSLETPFHYAYLDGAGAYSLEAVEPSEVVKTYELLVNMNKDYLRSVGVSRADANNLAHQNFAGTRHGDLRATWIDELKGEIQVTIYYETVPAEDDFVVAGKMISFEVRQDSEEDKSSN